VFDVWLHARVRGHLQRHNLGTATPAFLARSWLYVEKSNEKFTVTINSNLIDSWPNDWSRL